MDLSNEWKRARLSKNKRKASYALPHNSKFDIIIEFFADKRQYDIYEIYKTLFVFDRVLFASMDYNVKDTDLYRTI